MTKAANDETDLQKQFDALKGDHDKLTADHAKLTETNGKLAADYETQGGKLDEAVAAQKNAVAERNDFEKKLKDMTGERDDAVKGRDEATAALEKAKKDLDDEIDAHKKTKADLSKASTAPKVSRGEKSPKPRKAAPMTFDDDNPKLSNQELLEKLREGPHSIVLSDGKHEITSVEPINVSAEAFQPGPNGLVMVEPVRVCPENGPITIRGYALLDEKGNQVDWGEPITPIQVPARQEVELKREFVFGRAA